MSNPTPRSLVPSPGPQVSTAISTAGSVTVWLAVSVAVALAPVALATGCGGSSAARIRAAQSDGPVGPVVLPPVKPEALLEFEAGMRALRLAGERPAPDAYEKAAERLRKAVELDSKVWEAWHNLGVIATREGNDDAAVEAFGKALAINPAHTDSLLARAEAHRRAGRDKDARGDYEQAIARSPEDSPVRRDATARLASLLRESKQYDDALAVIRETLRLSGANAKVYVELGYIYMAQGRDELAQLVLSKASELDAKEPAIYNALALLALSRGRSQEAFERFDHATSLDPRYSDARFNKASVLLDVGDYATAKTELTAVVNQNPDDLAAQVALGIAHRGLGAYDQAQKLWNMVVDRAPLRSATRADALFNLAMLQMNQLENEKAAADALDRYLQHAPAGHAKRVEAKEKKKELGL